jgi:PAS domain S-box-containing protein
MSSDGYAATRTASAITVPAAPDSVRRVRRALRATLDGAGVAEETVDTAVLLASELVTNAVLHARTDVQVTIVVDGVVRVEVHDESGMMPASRSHAVDSMTGRGLQIVGQLADDYGVEVEAPTATGSLNGGGKTVWFCLAGNSTHVHDQSADHFPDLVPTSGPTITAEWRDLPLLLFDVVMEHNEALMREFALEQLGELDPTEELAASPLAAAAAARARLAQAVDAYRPLARTQRHVDVTLQLEPRDVAALANLLPVLRAAEQLSATGRILTPPALPELRELREWCVTEIVRQADGAVPRPWSTPYVDDRVPVEMSADERAAAQQIWQSSESLLLARSDVIVAVSPSAATLLGWQAEDLVGRRITVVVPPDLRDVHLAGITRHLMTGRTTMLGVEAPISAWHRKGYEVPVRLLLDRWPGVQSLFVARFGSAD